MYTSNTNRYTHILHTLQNIATNNTAYIWFAIVTALFLKLQLYFGKMWWHNISTTIEIPMHHWLTTHGAVYKHVASTNIPLYTHPTTKNYKIKLQTTHTRSSLKHSIQSTQPSLTSNHRSSHACPTHLPIAPRNGAQHALPRRRQINPFNTIATKHRQLTTLNQTTIFLNLRQTPAVATQQITTSLPHATNDFLRWPPLPSAAWISLSGYPKQQPLVGLRLL